MSNRWPRRLQGRNNVGRAPVGRAALQLAGRPRFVVRSTGSSFGLRAQRRWHAHRRRRTERLGWRRRLAAVEQIRPRGHGGNGLIACTGQRDRAGRVPAARSIHTWNRRAVRTRACSDEPTRGGRGLAYKRAMTGRRVRYEYGGGTGAGRSRHRPTYRSAEYTRGRTRREAVTPCEQRERLPSFGGGGGHPHRVREGGADGLG